MKKILSVVAGVFITVAANADMVTVYSDSSWDGPGNTINDIFSRNGLNFGDYSQVDVETWITQNAGCLIIEEVAGNRNFNAFGWYDVSDPITLHQIFPGAETPGAIETVVFSATDNVEVGFYLEPFPNALNGASIFYSQQGLNGGIGQLAVFQNTSSPREYILAWEDLSMRNGSSSVPPVGWVYNADTKADGDFNDFVVKVTVPEPATLGFLGLSILSLSGLSFFRRKRN